MVRKTDAAARVPDKEKTVYVNEHISHAELCASCGDVIPEGRQVCPLCEMRAERS